MIKHGLSKEDFASLQADVYSVPHMKVSPEIYECFHYPEFAVPIDIEGMTIGQVLKYIVLFYDRSTPLRKIPDIPKRRVIALEEAGFRISPSTNEFHENVIRMVAGDFPEINKMIIRFLRNHKNDTYSYFCVLQDAFYAAMARMKAGDKVNISEFDRIREQMDGQLKELTNEDNQNKRLQKELLEFYDLEELRISPEHIAHALKRGESPDID